MQNTPETKDTNQFLGKDGKLNPEVIAKFQEALKADPTAIQDISKSLGVAPTPNQPGASEAKTPDVQKLKEIYSFALQGLKDAGIDPTATPIQSKMSEYEEQMNAKIESIAIAKFSEQLADIVKVDSDFPVDTLKNLKVPTEIKIAVADALKGIVTKNSKGIEKLQTELDKVTSEFKEIQAKVPAEPKPDTRSGSERVREMAGKFGLDVNDITGLKDESKPDPAKQLADALKALQENK